MFKQDQRNLTITSCVIRMPSEIKSNTILSVRAFSAIKSFKKESVITRETATEDIRWTLTNRLNSTSVERVSFASLRDWYILIANDPKPSGGIWEPWREALI